MAVILCPFCARENDDEREICQYCQARLKPIQIDSESPGGIPGLPQVPAQGVFDENESGPGLTDRQQPPAEIPAKHASEPESSDWLAGFRGQISTQDLSARELPIENSQPPASKRSDLDAQADEGSDFLDFPVDAGMGMDGSTDSLLLSRIFGDDLPAGPSSQAGEPGFQDRPHNFPIDQAEFAGEIPAEPAQDPGPGKPAGADELSWLRDLQSQFHEPEDLSAGEQEEGWLDAGQLDPGYSTVDGERLPDWVEEISARPLDGEKSSITADPASTDLPAWLDSIRSPATPQNILDIPPDFRGQVEIAGPLAGLQGILPAEPEISLGRKGAAYSETLPVSEAHRLQAEIFNQVIQSEGKNRPLPDRYLVTSQKIMRLAIACIIFLAVLVPVFSLQYLELVPAITPGEVLAASQIVNSIGNAAPVLIAVEYDPGFSGEMDAALAAVMDHLMIQGAFLVFISTNSSGPMQAERILELSNQVGTHQYASGADGSDYLNLGFISGGMAGVRNFAQNPRAASALDLTTSPAWDHPALVNVAAINDFSAIIVASESYEKARLWIEQVTPILQGTPLVVVSSAQSAPLLRPYYDASPQQVQGLVSGVIGSVHYAQAIGRRGIAHIYWPSFNSGLLAALILIVVGGGANAMMTLVSAQDGRRKGGKQV